MKEQPKSVYHTGGADGLYMGIALIIVLAVMIMSMNTGSTLLSMLFLLLAFPGIIALAATLLRKRWVENGYRDSYSALWMHGITMFVCANLLMSLAMYLFLRFIDPEFLMHQVLNAATLYEQVGSPETDQMAHTLHTIIEKHLLPTPIEFSFSCMWFGSFAGCILSMALSFLVRMAKPKMNPNDIK